MNMMLLAIFASIGVGVFARRFGRFEGVLIVSIATALTLIYFLRPQYMT